MDPIGNILKIILIWNLYIIWQLECFLDGRLTIVCFMCQIDMQDEHHCRTKFEQDHKKDIFVHTRNDWNQHDPWWGVLNTTLCVKHHNHWGKADDRNYGHPKMRHEIR